MINHIDLDGVFEAYRRINWGFESTYFEESILAHSKRKEIQAWACRSLLGQNRWRLIYGVDPRAATAESFESNLQKAAKNWNLAVGQFADVKIDGKDFKQIVMRQLESIETQVQQTENADPDRVKRLLQVIENIRRGPT
jgi:hypothetical protein